MSWRVSRTKRFSPATLQSCTALLIASAIWEALHPAAALPAAASAAATAAHITRRARPARMLRMVPPGLKGTTTFRQPAVTIGGARGPTLRHAGGSGSAIHACRFDGRGDPRRRAARAGRPALGPAHAHAR